MRADRWNIFVFDVAIAAFAFIGGFALGNTIAFDMDFNLRDWQPLVGAMVAVGAAALGFAMTWQTQKITVLIKEQDRIDTILPALKIFSKTLSSKLERINGHPDSFYDLCASIIHAFRPSDDISFDSLVTTVFPTAGIEESDVISPLIASLVFRAELALRDRGTTAEGTWGKMVVLRMRADIASLEEFSNGVTNRCRDLVNRRNEIEGHLRRYWKGFRSAHPAASPRRGSSP